MWAARQRSRSSVRLRSVQSSSGSRRYVRVAVVRVRPVFAGVVAGEQVLGRWGGRGQGQGVEGDVGDRLADDRVFQGLAGAGAPGEGAGVRHGGRRDLDGLLVLLPQEIHDDDAGVVLVVLRTLLGGEVTRDGDGSVEGLGVGGAEGRI